MYELVTLKVWSLCFNLVCEADDEALLYRVRVQNPVNILSKGKCFWYTIFLTNFPDSKGAKCKMMGARVSIRASKPPKDVKVKTYNSTGGYYSVSGSFRGVQFQEDPVIFPLTAELTVPGVGTLSQTLTDC
ncbi:hypothetical protein Naga_100353g4 [Nannochloropsis gaditana]|uniref:Uncharacterized protein n=1 Tax=Nannochloropsis gaditana TaxID=72520 RepID=W7TNP0_9STRA|nr:hypothetical protein Naga_100353g4 [Nannochloropsis gaditana]